MELRLYIRSGDGQMWYQVTAIIPHGEEAREVAVALVLSLKSPPAFLEQADMVSLNDEVLTLQQLRDFLFEQEQFDEEDQKIFSCLKEKTYRFRMEMEGARGPARRCFVLQENALKSKR